MKSLMIQTMKSGNYLMDTRVGIEGVYSGQSCGARFISWKYHSDFRIEAEL